METDGAGQGRHRTRYAVARRLRAICAGALGVALAACASVNGGASLEEDPAARHDPLEVVNRQVFAANLAIDTFILRPAAVAYREVVPDFGKDIVRNFLNHIRLPFVLINDLAQGEMRRAETTISRFLVNSVIGFGGLFDPATSLGLAYHQEDVGQTLAVYGIDDGPYLVLPLLGPSNFRDAVGLAVGWLVDPVRIGAEAADGGDLLYSRAGTEAIDGRYRSLGTVDAIRERSLDFYATVRSLYRQRRINEIQNRSPGGIGVTPDLTAKAVAPGADPAMRPAAVELAEAPFDLRAPDEPPDPFGVSIHDQALRAHEAAQRAYERAMQAGTANNGSFEAQ